MLGDEIRKKNKKNDKRPQNSSNIKEWRPNSKQKKIRGELTLIDSKVKLKKTKYLTKNIKTKTRKKKQDQTWSQNKIKGRITF
jgi:hypothetical protein